MSGFGESVSGIARGPGRPPTERGRAVVSSPFKRPPSGAAVSRTDVTEALSRALMLEWARTGYAALSLETVARRAGTGKAALYRRWPSKLAMVSDRLAAFTARVGSHVDTGALETDVRAVLRETRLWLRHPIVRRILPDLHAEAARSSDLARVVETMIKLPRQRLFADLIRRAVLRRELSTDVDSRIAADLADAMIYWRLVIRGGRIGDDDIDALTDAIVAALRGRWPR